MTTFFQSCAYRAHCDAIGKPDFVPCGKHYRTFCHVPFVSIIDSVCLSETLRGSGSPEEISSYTNVNGVRSECLEIGCSTTQKDMSQGHNGTSAVATGQLYFLAKKNWAKGWKQLYDLLEIPAVLKLLDQVTRMLHP